MSVFSVCCMKRFMATWTAVFVCIIIYSTLHLFRDVAKVTDPSFTAFDEMPLHIPYVRRRDFEYKDQFKARKVIFTNIGIVVPAYFNRHTLLYLDRLLHNIYLSQIDFGAYSMENATAIDTANALYVPSEVIISMSIMSADYHHEKTMRQIIKFYHDHVLLGDSHRLQLVLHRDIEMNAAQNRNYGMSQMDQSRTDYVGFFDIDDVMHPQRVAILYHIFRGNSEHIDLLFHSFIINRECQESHIQLNYLPIFHAESEFLDDTSLESLSQPITSQKIDFCVAFDRSKKRKKSEVAVLKINCQNQEMKDKLIKYREYFMELVDFDRFYHQIVRPITFLNYSQLIERRCKDRDTVTHPIGRKRVMVDCDYGTMAQGLEAFRNEKAITRHHNGWPTVRLDLALNTKYDEEWQLHGSYRGQDAAFNVEVYRQKKQVFHLRYYLGIYCH